jgi:uncharacterized protein (DUF1778 family)
MMDGKCVMVGAERERAAYYESHKDEPGDWGEAEPPKERRRLASMISVRLSPEEAAVVRAAAERQCLSVSAFLRNAALREARTQGPAVPAQATALERATGSVSNSTVRTAVTILTAPPSVDPALIGDTRDLTSGQLPDCP